MIQRIVPSSKTLSMKPTESEDTNENELEELLNNNSTGVNKEKDRRADLNGSNTPLSNSNNSLKWIALISLIVQNSGLAVVMRYTFLLARSTNNPYIPSTAVLNAEILKLLISTVACFVYDSQQSQEKFFHILYNEMYVNYRDFLKLFVPSILYTIQNSLQYFSMQCLSAPVFQVLYQMKIITTAMFSVLLLAKKLSPIQWSSIVALTVGVAIVQLSQGGARDENKTNSLAGFISVILGCLTSGFAGVYFEMVLKSTSASIWLRNIQLSLIGIGMSLISCYLRDSADISNRGLLAGYNSWVWGVIILQAAGGMLVAVVVKYADNVLKGFATSLSIVLSALVSALYFTDVEINLAFVLGAAVVLSSVYYYGYNPAPSTVSSK